MDILFSVLAVLVAPMVAHGQKSSDSAFASSGNAQFDAWRQDFAARALRKGHTPTVVRQVLGGLAPDPRMIAADTNQAEFVKPIWKYTGAALRPERIELGRKQLAEMRDPLAAIEKTFGVPTFILAAIWGMESNYGSNLGGFDAPRTLATMAFQGRRRAFGESQLLAIMHLLASGEVTRQQLRLASWAGAVGHTQFMPATFAQFAVDWDGDKRKDLWASAEDALASAANYLARSGWKPGIPWVGEARLPTDFDLGLADGRRRRVAQWRELGVTPANEAGFGHSPWYHAELFLPTGREGPAFLLFDNFKTLKRYNNSDSYALSVGLLADALAGRPGLGRAWPTHLSPLSSTQIRKLQRCLEQLGHRPGGIDGLAGRRTRAALRRFQKGSDLPADGFPTKALLASACQSTP